MELVIGNANYSSWSMRPWIFISHHNLPVEITRLPLFSSPLRDKLSGHFSNGRVPLLIDGDTDVWESLAILEYLNEQFDGLQGWPEDPRARAVARSVCGEMHSGFSALRNEIPMNIRRRFPDYRISEKARADVARVGAVWRYCRRRFAGSGPWLFGAFSIADAMFAPVVMRFRSVTVELDDDALEYCDTVSNSDAVQRWIDMAYQERDIIAVDELAGESEQIRR